MFILMDLVIYEILLYFSCCCCFSLLSFQVVSSDLIVSHLFISNGTQSSTLLLPWIQYHSSQSSKTIYDVSGMWHFCGKKQLWVQGLGFLWAWKNRVWYYCNDSTTTFCSSLPCQGWKYCITNSSSSRSLSYLYWWTSCCYNVDNNPYNSPLSC